MRGEHSIAALCRRKQIAQSLYDAWSKEFLEAGIEALQRAVQVDPYRPDGRLTDLGFAQFVAGHYEDTVLTFKRISALQAKHHSYLAACYALLDDTNRVDRHATEVRRLEPDFSAEAFVEQVHYKNNMDRDHHIETLHKAGL